MKDVFESATGTPAPAIESAVKLYGLLNDVLTPEAQLKLCRYFQVLIKLLSVFLTIFFLSCICDLSPMKISSGGFKEEVKKTFIGNKRFT